MLVADRRQTLEEYLLSVEARIDEVVAEILALRAENAELRAKWNAVPWDDLDNVSYLAGEYAKYHLAQAFGDTIDYDQAIRNVDTFRRNAPKAAASE